MKRHDSSFDNKSFKLCLGCDTGFKDVNDNTEAQLCISKRFLKFLKNRCKKNQRALLFLQSTVSVKH